MTLESPNPIPHSHKASRSPCPECGVAYAGGAYAGGAYAGVAYAGGAYAGVANAGVTYAGVVHIQKSAVKWTR